MKAVTTAQMQELDRRTIHEFGIPGAVLMERAGHGVARIVRRILRLRQSDQARVLIVAGRGNNGGDAFVAARYLHACGAEVEVLLTGSVSELRGDAAAHFERMRCAGVVCHPKPTVADWETRPAGLAPAWTVIVDGILGTGVSGPVRDLAATAIHCINALASHVPVIAIDVPSGLNSDTGVPEGLAVLADVTVTMGLPKRGLLQPAAVNYVGNLEVVDIGIPQKLLAELSSDLELIAESDLLPILTRRRRDSHKGNFGHLLIISGAAGYAGAVGMAARAALRSGVGLVTALVPECVAAVVAGMAPEAMIHRAAQTEIGSLSAACLRKWGRNVNDFDAVLVGPGMTTHPDSARLVEQLLQTVRTRLIIDADGLNVLAGRTELIRQCPGTVIITPHPGEMARLLGWATPQVQADRFEAARKAANQTGALVVLKGAGTVLAAPQGRILVNMTGNPGMAKGGMGDVLAGLLGGIAAQGLQPLEAAQLAVYIHGRAGDTAAWHTGQIGLTAAEVLASIPLVFAELSGR